MEIIRRARYEQVFSAYLPLDQKIDLRSAAFYQATQTVFEESRAKHSRLFYTNDPGHTFICIFRVRILEANEVPSQIGQTSGALPGSWIALTVYSDSQSLISEDSVCKKYGELAQQLLDRCRIKFPQLADPRTFRLVTSNLYIHFGTCPQSPPKSYQKANIIRCPEDFVPWIYKLSKDEDVYAIIHSDQLKIINITTNNLPDILRKVIADLFSFDLGTQQRLIDKLLRESVGQQGYSA